MKPGHPGVSPCAAPANLSTSPVPLNRRVIDPALHTSPHKCQLPEDEKHLRIGRRAVMPAALQHSLKERTISCFREACHHGDELALCTHSKSSCEAGSESHVGSQDAQPENNSVPREKLQALTEKHAHTTERSTSSGDVSPEPVPLPIEHSESVMITCIHGHCPGWKRVMRRVVDWATKLCCCVPAPRQSQVSRNKVVPVRGQENGMTSKARR